MIIRRSLLAGLALVALCACQTTELATAVNPPVGPAPVYIQRAVNSAERPAAQKARDFGRKPKEVLTFWGLKEGDRIIELASFGQYYTIMLADAVGPKGHIYMYDLPYMKARTEGPSKAFVAGHPNTEYAIGAFDQTTFPKDVDGVMIMMYYHDLKPNKIDTAVLNKKLYDALKPGGRVVIEDHRAEPGSGWRDAGTIHRMDTAVIVQEMEAAGFKLVIDSNILANPADDHKKMVFDPGERGTTDRSLFVFQKPK